MVTIFLVSDGSDLSKHALNRIQLNLRPRPMNSIQSLIKVLKIHNISNYFFGIAAEKLSPINVFSCLNTAVWVYVNMVTAVWVYVNMVTDSSSASEYWVGLFKSVLSSTRLGLLVAHSQGSTLTFSRTRPAVQLL